MQFHRGSVEVICGGMFSGKTEELIRRVRRAEFAKQQIQVFKPEIDTRTTSNRVASHSGFDITAETCENSIELRGKIRTDTVVVAIDEAQFFDSDIARLVEELAQENRRVIIAGLDMDFRAEPFGAMPILVIRAENVTKLHAICTICGEEASRSQRLIDGKPAYYEDTVILVGASDHYEARCRKHHIVPHRSN